MKKFLDKKLISLILSLLIIISFNSGFVYAGGNKITYDNSENLIEKISNPTEGEGMPDGILGKDRSNSYAWSLAEFDDYVYIGSNRNLLMGQIFRLMGAENEDLTKKIFTDLSDGDLPTDNLGNDDGQIFRYDLNNKRLEEFYKSSGSEVGFRVAVTFAPKGESESLYFGTTGEESRVIRIDENSKKNVEPEVVYKGGLGGSNVRAMATHEDSLCIGVLTTEVGDRDGNIQIMQSKNPAIDEWKEIASIDDFAISDPRLDPFSAGQAGVWDIISYNGSIYAFIGTGYLPKDSPNYKPNGYSVFKGTEVEKGGNEAGWDWKLIVGPEEDEEGKPTGAKYPRGMGNQYDGSASPFLYTDSDGETYVYVCTFDAIFDSFNDIVISKSYESLHKAMHPAKIYRFDKDDNWEMVIGNPDEHFESKIGSHYAGFSDSEESSKYSPNLYMWRMAEYKGELFISTLDPTVFLDIVVPPLKINLAEYDKSELMAIINLLGIPLPEKVEDTFTEALENEDTTSAAAIEADEMYNKSVEVEEAGKEAFDAIDNLENYINELENMPLIDATKSISSLITMFSSTAELEENKVKIEQGEEEQEQEQGEEGKEEGNKDNEEAEQGEIEKQDELEEEKPIKNLTINSIFDSIVELNNKTENFKDLATENIDSNIYRKSNLMRDEITARDGASRTANAADTASSLTAELVEELAKVSNDNEMEVMPNQDFIDKITAVIGAIEAAYKEAKDFKAAADTELEGAKSEAEEAKKETSIARKILIEVFDKLNSLLGEISADQYTDISKLLEVIIDLDLGYDQDELKDLMIELQHIIELRIMISTNQEAEDAGCSVYRSKDGINFTPVTTNGFNDKYNWGVRTFLPTDKGLFMGTANPFYGAQLWRLGDLEDSTDPVKPIEPIKPIEPTDPLKPGTSSSGSGGGGSSYRSDREVTEDEVEKEIITELELDSTPLGSLKLELEKKDHYAYIVGYEDGNIKPLKNTSREEVAMIFYKLLTDESRKAFSSDDNPFKDVDKNKWSNKAISTLHKAGILEGYEDESFRPLDFITRAEFVSIAAKFDEVKGNETSELSDIKGHWAEKYINHAASKRWISGYQDGTFKPDQEIIRAEVMELTNNIVGRKVSKENIHLDAKLWPDNPKNAWYYEAIMEATNSHDYIYKDGKELWTGIKDDKVWP